MKVFISGSKCVKKSGKEWALPEKVRSCLDGIISGGESVLVGDCWGIDTWIQEYLAEAGYANVTVYVSGSMESTRNNVGGWNEKHFSSCGKTGYTYRAVKDYHMAEDCDYGVAFWDGESRGTFINMLCLCALKKPCKLYLLREDRWVDIHTLEDLL